jgi:energy-coupling factor transporter ATP-binding protein EcfA2
MFGQQAPSRFDNPFATCWTKPGALQFRFAPGESAQQLLAKLAAQNWRGAIVGPHGSGKSTLLAAFKPLLSEAGRTVLAVALRGRQRQLPRSFVESIRSLKPIQNGLLVVDGFEQLGWRDHLLLAYISHRNHSGLLVTAHRPIRTPTLLQLAPNETLVSQLVIDLCAEVSTSVTSEDVAASHACHGSNVREIFFDLYDRHERKRRALRTAFR